MKLGSLFDGSGGFPLAASLCGIEPVWASEIEPYPIAVTRSRFPRMKHLGDINGIRGGGIEPVDIISFGSPCQDLSIAGKRAGIHDGARSNLFFEAIRVIREMRGGTNGQYPKFAIWENVPGAFSSNGGEDFRCVLEALARVRDAEADVSLPAKGKWASAGAVMGDGWSIAWRVLDAQYWGVPQRRRRIYLVADFAGGRAAKILFERENLRGDTAPGGAPGQGAAADAQDGAGAANRAGNCPAIIYPDVAHTLNARYDGSPQPDKGNGANIVVTAGFMGGQGSKAGGLGYKEELAPTLKASPSGGNTVPDIVYYSDDSGQDAKKQYLFENHSQDARYTGPLEVSPMLPAHLGTGGNNTPYVVENETSAYCMGNGQLNQISMAEQANTLDCMHDRQAVVVFDKEVYNSSVHATGAHYIAEGGPVPTLRTSCPPGVCAHYIVRRLTPTECARLQGFPDTWGWPNAKAELDAEDYAFWLTVRNTHAVINGKAARDYTPEQMLRWYNKLHTDSAEYKMWGNGIALPCARYVMEGVAQYC